jgi:hypothetical protein
MPLPTKANVTRPEAWGYQLLIEYGDTNAESLYLPLAVGPRRELQLSSVAPKAEEGGFSTEANPEDLQGETGRTFSRANFTGGEGLDRAHRRDGEERDWTRFWNSRNIDVSPSFGGTAEEIKLLHSTTALRVASASNLRNPLVRIGTVLYGVINSATQVDRTANPIAGAPTWTQEAPGGTGSIDDLTSLGDLLYAATSTIRQRASGGGWSSWSDLNADRIWGVKGRIVAAVGVNLYEAVAGVVSNSTLLYTLPSGQTWTDVVDAGAAILAAATDGNIYAFVDEDGELALRRQTQIEGEIPISLGYAQGYVFFGTGEATTGGGQIGRLWRSELVGLRLTNSTVLRQWGTGGETRDRRPHRIVATRDSIWCGVIEDGSETHLWRYYLETTGIARDLIMADSGIVHGIAVFDDRMFATINDQDLYRENTTYATTGYLISPLADFFSAGRKAWNGARLTPGSLPTGSDVHLAYSTDPAALTNPAHASWTTIISMDETTPASAYSAETAITEVESRYILARITMTPTAASAATPTVLAFAIRGLSLPTEEDFAIPINVSDQIERPNRKALKVPNSGEARYDGIRTLLGKTATITLLRPAKVIKGQLMGLSTPIQEIPERGSPMTYALLTIRGQRQ